MTNEIVPQVFENEEFGTIRTMVQEGNLLFCGADVAKALGYSKPNNALNAHCKGAPIQGTLQTTGGPQTVRFITEGDMYRLIASSKLESDQRFESWVFDDVIPAIRRDGAYVASDGTEDDATLMARALVAANRQIERNAARIAALAPKAGMFDACMSGERWQSFTEVARLLHQYDRTITRKRLFELAMDDGIITRDKQASKLGIDRGYVANYQAPAYFDQTTGEQVRPKPYAKVTSKGVSWMLGRYCKGGDAA